MRQGLGKTLQTISLLAYLREFRGITGPHMVREVARVGGCRGAGVWGGRMWRAALLPHVPRGATHPPDI